MFPPTPPCPSPWTDRLRSKGRPLPLCLLGALALLIACGGGGDSSDSGDSGVDAGSGSVAVIFTDGPVDSDVFEKILVTFTEIILISDSGHFTIFEDRDGKTIDLRELEDVGKLVTLGRAVPARTFSKIRLVVTNVELVPVGGGDSIFPKLPPKIDLNPRQTIRVKRGQLLIVQVDIDGGKSIHIVQTGNDKYIFRSVVFVDIIGGSILGKLVLLDGEVRDLDLGDESFLLCGTHALSKPRGGHRITESAERDFNENDLEDLDDFCVEILAEGASVFDESGDPAGLDVLMNGEHASVLGRFARWDDERLSFGAEVIQQGSAARAIDGEVLTTVVGDSFDMATDDGQGFPSGAALEVVLQSGTRIFSRRGRELTESEIQPDVPVRSVGVLVTGVDEFLKASVVVLDVDAMDRDKVIGEIVSKTSTGSRIEVEIEGGGVACVDVPESAEVFEVILEDHGGRLEMIGRSDLEVGDEVGAFGFPDTTDGCLDAEKVIVFADYLNS